MNILGIKKELETLKDEIKDSNSRASSLKDKIKNSGDRGLIILLILGFICYQYIPFSSVAGYLAGTLVTSFFVVCASLGACIYLIKSYGWVIRAVFKVWESFEEKIKDDSQQKIRRDIFEKCEEVGKNLREKDTRIKALEEQLDKQNAKESCQDPIEVREESKKEESKKEESKKEESKKEESKEKTHGCSHCNCEKTMN
jgi:hypothetical protein